jgi:hypothetical protein
MLVLLQTHVVGGLAGFQFMGTLYVSSLEIDSTPCPERDDPLSLRTPLLPPQEALLPSALSIAIARQGTTISLSSRSGHLRAPRGALVNMLLYGVMAPFAEGMTTSGFYVQTMSQTGAVRDEGGSAAVFIEKGQLANTSVSLSTLIAGSLAHVDVRFVSSNDNAGESCSPLCACMHTGIRINTTNTQSNK